MTIDLALLSPTPGSTLRLRIAIIGANGLVGAAVAKQALSQGHSVLALDRASAGRVELQEHHAYEYRQFDATDSRAYVRALRGCNACVHLAAVYNAHDDEGALLDDVFSQADVHNINTAMSYNALTACAELGISRVVLASSVNAIGLSESHGCSNTITPFRPVYAKRPRIDYLPIDELHPQRPEDAYSLSKSCVCRRCRFSPLVPSTSSSNLLVPLPCVQHSHSSICELQASSIAARHPSMRIASLRFHWVVPSHKVHPHTLDEEGGAWKDLWGWVSLTATADACLKGVLAPRETFPGGHEVFTIAAKTTCRQGDSMELLRTAYLPEKEGVDVRVDFAGTNRSFWDTSKAERMLGWKEEGWAWRG